MAGHDGLHDGKPHAGAAGVAARGEEGVKDLFPVGFGDRVAVIADDHPDGGGFVAASSRTFLAL